jgi:hypothetical protein
MPDELVKGVDYYVENGRWVFTAAFLLRRGYCCGSGCRHCPYGPQSESPGPAAGGSPAADSVPGSHDPSRLHR